MYGFSVYICRFFLVVEEEFVMNVFINYIEIFGILSFVCSFLFKINDYNDLVFFCVFIGIVLL